MSKINNDGLQNLLTNIKNPLNSMYEKVQKNGSLKWGDMKEEYAFIYKFLKEVQNEWDTSGSDAPPEPTVIVNNQVYKPDHQ
mgnify:CR=1 FL=1